MAAQPITVPFVSFRPMERELDADLRAAFARVLDNSWYIEGKEDAAFEAALPITAAQNTASAAATAWMLWCLF